MVEHLAMAHAQAGAYARQQIGRIAHRLHAAVAVEGRWINEDAQVASCVFPGDVPGGSRGGCRRRCRCCCVSGCRRERRWDEIANTVNWSCDVAWGCVGLSEKLVRGVALWPSNHSVVTRIGLTV